MTEPYTFIGWLRTQWSRAGLPLAVVLLTLTPFLYQQLGVAAFLVFLQLPLYMFHQYEEHAHGAFRIYINRTMGGGRDVLTDRAIAWINLLGVWALDLVALYLAVYVAPWLGLLAIYLTLVNAIAHIATSLASRGYNPGLWTSLALFLPGGGLALYELVTRVHPTIAMHACCLAVAVVVHLLIVAHIRRRIAQLATQQPVSVPS